MKRQRGPSSGEIQLRYTPIKVTNNQARGRLGWTSALAGACGSAGLGSSSSSRGPTDKIDRWRSTDPGLETDLQHAWLASPLSPEPSIPCLVTAALA